MQFSTQNDPLGLDIVSVNLKMLEMIARYSTSAPEEVCLRLNIPSPFMRTVQGFSSEKIAQLAHLNQFLFQPAVEFSVLENCTQLPVEHAIAYMRSATRLKIR